MAEIAFVGCAHIHVPGFIRMLSDHPEIHVKRVWDHEGERGNKYAGQMKAEFCPELAAVLRDKSLAGVIIASETNRHREHVTAAARAKKNMFVEKPLGLSGKDAAAMADRIEKAGVIFSTGYFMRSSGINRFLREQIQAGNFGKITRVRASNAHSGALGRWFDTEYRWMADPAIAGCGAFGDLGTHILDVLIWLLGEIESVTATVNPGTGVYGDCDETGEGLLKFKSGVIGTLAAAWDDLADPCKLLISGTEAHAVVINGQLFYQCKKIEGADGKQPWTQLPAALPHAFELFLMAISGQKDLPLVTPREAAYRNAVVDALYKAAKTNKWVAVT